MAIILNNLGYDLIITAKDEENLIKLKQKLNLNNKNDVYIIVKDLSKENECKELYEEIKDKFKNIDILINNAGFGLFGEFVDTSIDTQMNMIDVNIKAVQILTKLFLNDMVKVNKGRILNVASVAAFMPGPLMATYYSTKNYVLRISQAIKYELKKRKSNVKISVLCPGPVNTNFNNVANVKFNLKGMSSKYVAEYAIDKLLKDKFLIMPGVGIKLIRFISKILPDMIMAKMCYKMQEKKK